MGVEPINLPRDLVRALQTAGDRNGVEFGYLLDTAMRESSLDPAAKASGSTATGLFQFLEGTWLGVMKTEGPRLGYAGYAEAITRGGDGSYTVADPEVRAKILKLREDPQIAADLAAAYTKSNGDYLTERFGRPPSAGELYIAHFLGPAGAERLFAAGLADPDQPAATLFPRQAAANAAIFYQDGEARTVKQLYRSLVQKHAAGSDDAAFLAQQLASAPDSKAAEAEVIPSRFAPGSVSFTALFKTEAEAQARPLLEPLHASEGSAFFTQLYSQ